MTTLGFGANIKEVTGTTAVIYGPAQDASAAFLALVDRPRIRPAVAFPPDLPLQASKLGPLSASSKVWLPEHNVMMACKRGRNCVVWRYFKRVKHDQHYDNDQLGR